MIDFMRIVHGVVLSVVAGSLVACSLSSVDRGSRIVVRIEDPSEGAHLGPVPLVSNSPPPSVSGFDCIGVNVSGPGIPDTSHNPEPNLGVLFDRLIRRESYCSYRGILAGPISATAAGAQEIALTVPPGSPRLIQLIGFKERDGSNDCIREFDPGAAGPVIGPSGQPAEADAYEIGRVVVGLFGDMTVSLNPEWNSLSGAEQDNRALKCGDGGNQNPPPIGAFSAGPSMTTPFGDPSFFYDTRLAPAKIWVAGGNSTAMTYLPIVAGPVWASVAGVANPLNGPVLAPGSGVTNLVRVGGLPSPRSAENEFFSGGAWAAGGALGADFAFSAQVAHPSGSTYFFGGTANGTSATNGYGKVPANSDTPTLVGTIGTARFRAQTAVLANATAANSKIMIVGGTSGTSSLAACDIFNPVGPTMSACGSPYSFAVEGLALLAQQTPGGGIYGFGGATLPAGTYRNDVYFGDATGTTWTAKAPMIQPRADFRAFYQAGGAKILVIGGRSAATAAIAGTEVYDVLSNTWSPGPSLITARYQYGAVQLGDGRIFIFGGYGSGGTALSSVEIFTPTP